MDFVQQLSTFRPWKHSFSVDSRFKKAAVLVPLVFKNEKLQVLLTVRAQNLSRYSGDVAFPGGMQDPEDDGDYVKTALREAREEVGLDEDSVKILCQLRPCLTQHGIMVVPIVGLITNSSFNPRPNVAEVQECFYLPLQDITASQITYKKITVLNNFPYNILYLNTAGKRIWGVTANILVLLLLINKERIREFLNIPITYLDVDLFMKSANKL